MCGVGRGLGGGVAPGTLKNNVHVNSCTGPWPQLKAPAGICMVFWPPITGEVLKWKVMLRSPLMMISLSAGVPLTVKSLAWTVAGSAGSLRLTVKSVGAVPTIICPQTVQVTEQPVGVGVGGTDCAQYLPPVFKLLPLEPPQTIISRSVQTAV
jgi:hypothetical protein